MQLCVRGNVSAHFEKADAEPDRRVQNETERRQKM